MSNKTDDSIIRWPILADCQQ